MRKPPETIGASAEVCNPARGWLNLDALPAARGLKKEKLVRRSQKNESGKAAVVPVGVNLKKYTRRFGVLLQDPTLLLFHDYAASQKLSEAEALQKGMGSQGGGVREAGGGDL